MAAEITVVITESKSGKFNFKINGRSARKGSTEGEAEVTKLLMQGIGGAIKLLKLEDEEKRNAH